MCFVEYNWTAMVWQFRVGDLFTDWRGVRSLPSLQEWRDLFDADGFKLTRTDTRTCRVDPK